MINKRFKKTLKVLIAALAQFEEDLKSDNYNRIMDSINFIYQKREVYEINLEDLKKEILNIKNESEKLKLQLKNVILRNSIQFLVINVIDILIQEIDIEILLKKAGEKKEESSNFKKIKIFKSSFPGELESEINSFLLNDKFEILETMQSVESGVVCITFFYKEKK